MLNIPPLARWPADVFQEAMGVWFDPSNHVVKELHASIEEDVVTPDPDRIDQRVLMAIHREVALNRIQFGGVDGIIKSDTGCGRVRFAIVGLIRHMRKSGWIFPNRKQLEEIFERSPGNHRVESRWISVDAAIYDAAGETYQAIAGR